MNLKIDSFGRYTSGCTMYAKPGITFRDMQEYPCKDAFHSCNGECKQFAVLLEGDGLAKGKDADNLIKDFWDNRSL